MSDTSITPSQFFTFLEGVWSGVGRGDYPTVQSFDYSETLIFTPRDELSLAYEQRTQKCYDGQTDWLVSHWENGFIRILESGELELVNAQSGGRSELLIGTFDMRGSSVRIHFRSRTITNDPRLLCTERIFDLDGDTLCYEMDMQTTAVNQLSHHLRITLHRVDKGISNHPGKA